MGRSRQENERLDRLASAVKKGGGLPLPPFFSAILNELLDNGPANDAQLTAIVSAVGSFKASKVAETWGGSDHDEWEFLTSDLIHQLARCGYVTKDGQGQWAIGEKFVSGGSLEIIPERKGLNVAESVTVWPKEERDALENAAKMQSKVDQLIHQPRGKSHSQQVVNDLRNSAETHGRIHPIVKTRDRRIIDGRHRYEVDPEWPAYIPTRSDGTEITTDAEVLATILEDQRWLASQKISPAAIKNIELVLGELAKTNKVKRDRIEVELRENAARSNRAIAELVGVSAPTVAEVRAELEIVKDLQFRIHCYISTAGRGGGKTKHSVDCWCGEGKASPPQSKESAKSTPKQSTYADPILQQPVKDLWNHLGRPPTGPEMVAEAERLSLTIKYRGKDKVPAQNTWLRVRDEVEKGRKQASPPEVVTSPAPELTPSPEPGCAHEHTCIMCEDCGQIV